jgi:hypothetical protein
MLRAMLPPQATGAAGACVAINPTNVVDAM